MNKYVIGIDYGTLSARAVLLDVEDGREILESEFIYPHGILTEADISGGTPKVTTALEDPRDYVTALGATVKELLLSSGVKRESVVGLCIDCTASTVLPYLDDGTPLSELPEFRNDPEVYIKLWKHHGAENIAEDMTRVAKTRGEEWLSRYGGTVSGEWFFPKLAELKMNSPEAYARMDAYQEAPEWLTEIITGERVRSASVTGYKALWSEDGGYPSREYFREVDEKLIDLTEKVVKRVLPLGAVAGRINERGESLTGLAVGTVVAVPTIDAHSALPAAKITKGGELMVILGTSACHIVLSKTEADIKGICGRVMGGVVPNYYAYEAGQPCVGDMLAWFIKNCLPTEYKAEAERLGISTFDYLNTLAAKLEVEKMGLVALDWWNGNRSPYVDYNLSGVLVGLTLKTRPEEIYHALLSSIAFGTKRLVDLYTEGGITISRVVASGGIATKNPFLMEMLADVLGMDVAVLDCKQSGAIGSAIYAAVAAGCYPDITSAAEAMGRDFSKVYHPHPEKASAYRRLYDIYVLLSDDFARGDIMKRLRNN